MAAKQVDVFISGAGPVSLVLAYHLSKLGISVYIIDAANKASPNFPMYGRACTLYARTLELLDQFDLYEDLEQDAAIINKTWVYNSKGEKSPHGWRWMNTSQYQSFFDHVMSIRLKYSEDVFRSKLAEMGVPVHAPVRLVNFTMDNQAHAEYPITAFCEDSTGSEITVRTKYIIGADGAGSIVRKLAGIAFTGERKVDHWVRIDGIVKSNIPEARTGVGSIESATHGNVLFMPLDHGATRIGYVLSDNLFKKYGINMTAEQAAHEASLACAPWGVKFTQIDWHTVYGVQQHIAEQFQKDRVILAGDAADAHSSGSGQGMNVGIHDVTSLGWRLAGVLQGWYKPDVLANYSDERRAIALHLIRNDAVISALVSGKIPEYFEGRTESAHELFVEFLAQESGFTLGLDVHYEPNMLNDVSGSTVSIAVQPGHRGPDALLDGPGFSRPTYKRLLEVTKFNGKFHVLVFAGDPSATTVWLKTLRSKVDRTSDDLAHVVELITIVAGRGLAFDENLGIQKFGRGFWDSHEDFSAHKTYGISKNEGALVVLRPDGIVGLVAALDSWENVVHYFDCIVIPQEKKETLNIDKFNHEGLGQYMSPDENNLAVPENEK